MRENTVSSDESDQINSLTPS